MSVENEEVNCTPDILIIINGATFIEGTDFELTEDNKILWSLGEN